MSGGLSLPVNVAAAAPLVGFAAGIALVQGPFLGQRWPSATGIRVTAARDQDTSGGINAGKSLGERKREGLGWVCKLSLWEEGCRAGFGWWEPFAEFISWLTVSSQCPTPFIWTGMD